MPARPCRYLHLDVFTAKPLTGNQLAVVLDAVGLETDVMQRIAREMAFSETTFVLPAEDPPGGGRVRIQAPVDPAVDVRVRIFTPARELPMAGHPTIGTAFALAEAGRLEQGRASVVFGLGIGPTPVRLEWRGDRLRFAWMRQAAPAFGPEVADLPAVARALHVAEHDIRDTGLPVEEGTTGVPFLYVPMATRAAVDRAVPDASALTRFFAGTRGEERPVFLFSLEPGGDDARVYGRMFAPAFGIAEDPATGSAAGPLGGYLVRHGVLPADAPGPIVTLQGAAMGRPSRIHIQVDTREGRVTAVHVGGESVLVADGTLFV